MSSRMVPGFSAPPWLATPWSNLPAGGQEFFCLRSGFGRWDPAAKFAILEKRANSD
jgi:hypothetical protein